jgi:hypothetical protein
MKNFTMKTLSSSLVLIAILTGCKDNQAPNTATVESPPAVEVPAAAPTEPASETTTEATKTAEATPIPDTADAIWLAIDQKKTELKAAIDSGSLDKVHHQAFAIRDLVAALPSKSPALAAEDQTKLENEVKFVTTLADRLDETGDANDKVGTQENYDKLVTVLNGITRTK